MDSLDLIEEWFKGMGYEALVSRKWGGLSFESPHYGQMDFLIFKSNIRPGHGGYAIMGPIRVKVGWRVDTEVRAVSILDIHDPDFFHWLWQFILAGPGHGFLRVHHEYIRRGSPKGASRTDV